MLASAPQPEDSITTVRLLEEADKAQFLRQSLSVLILFCIAMALLMPVFGAEQARRTYTVVLVAATASIGLHLASRGHVEQSLKVLAYGGWLAISLAAMLNGGPGAPVMFGFPILVLVSGLAVGAGTTWAIVGLSMATIPLLWFAQREHWLPPVQALPAELVLLLVMVATLAAAMLVTRHRSHLARREERLRQLGQDLSRRVDEITARETLLELVVENVPSMIHYCDREFRCLFTNRPFQEFFGVAPLGLHGRSLQEILGDASHQILFPYVQKVLAGNQVFFRCRLTSPAGGYRHFECILVPDRERDGAIHGYFAQMLDVTDRERSEATLRAIAEGTANATGTDFFRSLVRQLSSALEVPFAVVSEALPDGQGIHHHAFWHTDRHLAIPDQALAGCPCGEVITNGRIVFHASGVARRFPECRELPDMDIESFYGMPLRNAAGEVLGVLAVMSPHPLHFSDELASVMAIFTARAGAELERQRAEATQRRSEEKFLRIFQSSPIPIALLHLDGRILEINEAGCRTWGGEATDLIGRTTLELGFWQTPAERERWKDRLLRDGRALDQELRVLTPGGVPHWLLVSSEIISLADGPAVLSFLVDVTERKRSEEALASINDELEVRVRHRTAELTSANKELESFAYSVSHDLRAPLRSIDGFSQILLADYGGGLDDEGQSHLRRIRRAAQRMGAVIDDLLQLSRVARQEMNRQTVDMGRLALEIFEDLGNASPGRKVAVDVQPGCAAEGDPLLLQVLLENLLGNAWKYTTHTAKARIEFGCEGDGGVRSYFVRDNGVGFDMAHASRLFRPFERLHHTHEFEGTGIGLASAARIVHRHGGRIAAESVPGAGTTFRFTLE